MSYIEHCKETWISKYIAHTWISTPLITAQRYDVSPGKNQHLQEINSEALNDYFMHLAFRGT